MAFLLGSASTRWFESRVGIPDEYPLDPAEIVQRDIVIDFKTGKVRVVAERKILMDAAALGRLF